MRQIDQIVNYHNIGMMLIDLSPLYLKTTTY